MDTREATKTSAFSKLRGFAPEIVINYAHYGRFGGHQRRHVRESQRSPRTTLGGLAGAHVRSGVRTVRAAGGPDPGRSRNTRPPMGGAPIVRSLPDVSRSLTVTSR